MTKASPEAFRRRHQAINQQWITQAKTDPEYGGAAFEKNLKIAKSAVAHLGGTRLKRVLEETASAVTPSWCGPFGKSARSYRRRGLNRL